MSTFPEQFLALAMAQQGKPYVLGAAGPNAFDCSGLVLYCWTQLTHIECPHNDRAQWDWWGQHPELGTRFTRETMGGPQNLKPGDLMWPGGDGHEMIVVNSTTYLQAPYTGAVVSLATLDWNKLDNTHGGYRCGRFVRMHPPGFEPAPIEEDEMFYSAIPMERVDDQAEKHVWVSPEAWFDLADAAASCYLVVKNEGPATSFDLFTTPPSKMPTGVSSHYNLPEKNDINSRGAINLAAFGAPKGGFSVTVKSTSSNLALMVTIKGNKK